MRRPAQSTRLPFGRLPKPLLAVLAGIAGPAEARGTTDPVPCNSDIFELLSARAGKAGALISLPGCQLTLSRPVSFTAQNVGLRGDGTGRTVITYTGPAGTSALRFGPARISSGELQADNFIADLTINAATVQGTGTGLLLEQVLNFKLTNVSVNQFAIGIDAAGVSNLFISRFQLYYGDAAARTTTPGTRGLRVRAGYTSGRAEVAQNSYGIFVSDSSITSVATGPSRLETGIELLGVDGFYMNGPNYVGGAANLIDISPLNSSTHMVNIIVNGAMLDGNNKQSANGIRIRANASAPSATVAAIAIGGNIITSFSNVGVQLDSPRLFAVTLTGNTIRAADSACIDLKASAGVAVSGNTLFTCGTPRSGATGGIRYTSANGAVAIVGNSFSSTPAGASEVVAAGKPAHIQQNLNATDSGGIVPVLSD